MYETISQLMDESESSNTVLHELIIKDESEYSHTSESTIIQRLKRTLEIMKQSLEKALASDIELPIKEASNQAKKMLSKGLFYSNNMKEAIAWSMAIGEYNSGMGLIVACPTAGSSGVVPAVLFKAKEILEKSDEDVLNALIVGAAVGSIIGNQAMLSGSEGGCQAEIGVASAMAAAAITYMAGGTHNQITNAIALTLKNILGLVCDPVAGLVISPCIKRNAIGVVNAFLAAEMALSGVTSVIPADEVINAMKKVGMKLPYELKETGKGGIAATKTGKQIKKRIFSDIE
ncbi:MAG TPA: L-serine ammonia-lyase, iron-sulfur-dependent, subunit alpha [Candidatus Nanopelagicaceae bacterium]|nr:L-serine ammonia-lyase, iron-sulfur-dependent, subunit alpha [Candidatus Nanopelagicaceae bacterium]